MLVRGELFGANAEELIDGPKLEIAVTQRREPSLNADLAVTEGKGLFADGDVEVNRLDRQKIQQRFLSRGRVSNGRQEAQDKRHRVPMVATGQGTRDHGTPPSRFVGAQDCRTPTLSRQEQHRR